MRLRFSAFKWSFSSGEETTNYRDDKERCFKRKKRLLNWDMKECRVDYVYGNLLKLADSNSFSYERFYTLTRFETEAQGNIRNR